MDKRLHFLLKLTPNYKERTYGLDVLRAVAILLVVHSHGRFMLKNTFLEHFPWVKLVDGVDLFFVLSGFLIGGILLKIIHCENYKLTKQSFVLFWKRRWFRTLPNYYLILVVNILLVKYQIIDGRIDQFDYTFFLFLQNFATPFYGFFWESWSLSVEEWFYIVFPLLLVILLKILPNKNGILLAILLLLFFPLLYRITQATETVNYFWWDVTFRKTVVMRLDAIVYGVLAAYVKFYHLNLWKKYPVFLFVLGCCLLLSIEYFPNLPNDFFTKTFFFSGIAIGAMFLLPLADSVQKFHSFFGKIITHISLISYSMYLVNLAIVASVISKNFPIVNATDGVLKYVLYWSIVLVLSTVIYYVFEKPMLKLREKKFFQK